MSANSENIYSRRHGSGVVKSRKVKQRGKIDLKMVMCGSSDVGKTSLVLRYMEREYMETISTIGASFLLKTWGIHDIAIWDTAGEEKFTGMSTFYFRNASAAMLTFDIFDRDSLFDLNHRFLPVLSDVAPLELKVIVATKKDLLGKREREVSEEQGMEFAKQVNPSMDFSRHAIPYFETSAMTGENVDEAFQYIFEYFFPQGVARNAIVSPTNGVDLERPIGKTVINCCF